MNTRLLMTAAAMTLGIAGIALTFIPEEILRLNGLESNKSLQILLQMLGALYFAFAMLNWMTRTSLIGGIYGRPIVLANFTHCFVGGMALTKAAIGDPGLPSGMLAGLYAIFAVSFGMILLRHPKGPA